MKTLVELLESLFTVDELRRFVMFLPSGREVTRGLPISTSSLAEFALQTIAALERHGAIDDAFFARLKAERPARHIEIEMARIQFIANNTNQTNEIQTSHSIQPRIHDGYTSDVYINSVKVDESWVSHVLRPRLEAARICVLTNQNFRLGVPIIQAMARAIECSRYTLVVLSKAAITDGFANLTRAMAQHLGGQLDDARLLGVLREPCALPLELSITSPLDMSHGTDIAASIERLIENCRQQRPRRGI